MQQADQHGPVVADASGPQSYELDTARAKRHGVLAVAREFRQRIVALVQLGALTAGALFHLVAWRRPATESGRLPSP
jgi:hypothetical protein